MKKLYNFSHCGKFFLPFFFLWNIFWRFRTRREHNLLLVYMGGWEAAQIVSNIKTAFDKTPHEKETIFSGSDHISAIWKSLLYCKSIFFQYQNSRRKINHIYTHYTSAETIWYSLDPFFKRYPWKVIWLHIGLVVIVTFENVRKLTKPDDWVCQETRESFPPEHLPMSQSASARPQKTWKMFKGAPAQNWF